MTWLILLGAGSGLCWGVADFFGGLQSRRLPALTVAFWSQVAGALALLVVLVVRGELPVMAAITWGAAGVFGGLGLALFYRGLAVGTMSVVAPVAACGAIVPVIVGLARGEAPGVAAGLGILAALAGIVLVSLQMEPGTTAKAGTARPALLLALGAALCFGLFFVFLDGGASVTANAPLWTVAGARLSSLPTLALLIVAGPRALPWPGRRLGAVAAIGLLDTTANVLFAFASTRGTLGVAATLASLYPVATVLLGRLVLNERLGRVQGMGVVLALVGVALLSLR